jgi:hypothetical protein
MRVQAAINGCVRSTLLLRLLVNGGGAHVALPHSRRTPTLTRDTHLWLARRDGFAAHGLDELGQLVGCVQDAALLCTGRRRSRGRSGSTAAHSWCAQQTDSHPRNGRRPFVPCVLTHAAPVLRDAVEAGLLKGIEHGAGRCQRFHACWGSGRVAMGLGAGVSHVWWVCCGVGRCAVSQQVQSVERAGAGSPCMRRFHMLCHSNPFEFMRLIPAKPRRFSPLQVRLRSLWFARLCGASQHCLQPADPPLRCTSDLAHARGVSMAVPLHTLCPARPSQPCLPHHVCIPTSPASTSSCARRLRARRVRSSPPLSVQRVLHGPACAAVRARCPASPTHCCPSSHTPNNVQPATGRRPRASPASSPCPSSA